MFRTQYGTHTRLRLLMHRMMPTYVERLVYATHILPLYEQSGLSATYVPHPCVRPEIGQGNEHEWQMIIEKYQLDFDNVAFCPSASVKLSKIEQMRINYLILCSYAKILHRPNVECYMPKVFENYGKAMASCDFVGIFFDIEHKVSGPVSKLFRWESQLWL